MFKVKHETELELSFEQAGKLVSEVLMEDFDFLSKEILEGRAKARPSAVDMEDLLNAMDTRDAMQRVLKYYLKHDDYLQFMELQRVYGNVQ